MGGVPSLTSNCFCTDNNSKSYEDINIIRNSLQNINNKVNNRDILVNQKINNIENKLLMIYEKFTRIEDKIDSKFDLLLLQNQKKS